MLLRPLGQTVLGFGHEILIGSLNDICFPVAIATRIGFT